MTGTWRDTLFVWHGPISIEKKGEGKVEWKGNWIGCEDCPDATEAKLPTGFDESDMAFDVSGAAVKDVSEMITIFMTGGTGWDLQGEDQIDRHGDDRHEIMLKMVGSVEGDETDQQEKTAAVAAVGDNNFGSFVSAGFIAYEVDGTMLLTLGRRYLDHRDERGSWTVEQLHDKVEAAHQERDDKGKLPWHTKDLHAKTMTKRKAKRQRKK
jgi:hypothetical protein